MGAGALEGADERRFIQEIAGQEGKLAVQVGDASIVGLGDAADEAEDLVAVCQQELRQVAAVLSRDPGDHRPSLLAHSVSFMVSPLHRITGPRAPARRGPKTSKCRSRSKAGLLPDLIRVELQ